MKRQSNAAGPPAPGEVSFLGISVHPKTLDEWTDTVGQMIDEQRKGIIANHNLHSLYLFHRSREFREFYRKAVWTYIDGMPIIALARLYGHRLSRSQRITNVDGGSRTARMANLLSWFVSRCCGGGSGRAPTASFCAADAHEGWIL